jgi:hypothetical protein
VELTPGQRALLPFWGTIVAAAHEGVGTAELWERVRSAAEDQGLPLRGAGAVDMSRLRGIATQQRVARRNFERASTSDMLTADHIAQDISSRDLAAQAAAPQWAVRFEWQTLEGGVMATEWKTNLFTGILPQTKGELLDQLARDAERLGADYGRESVGIGAVSILAV